MCWCWYYYCCYLVLPLILLLVLPGTTWYYCCAQDARTLVRSFAAGMPGHRSALYAMWLPTDASKSKGRLMLCSRKVPGHRSAPLPQEDARMHETVKIGPLT